MTRRPPRGQGVAEASPVQVLAGRHPVLALVEFLAECMALRCKVADPGAYIWELAVAFSVSVGDWFGGAQRLDLVAGVAAAQFGVGGDGQVPGGGGGLLPGLPVGHGLGEGVFSLLVEVTQGPVAGGQGLVLLG